MRFEETRSGRDVCHQRYVRADKSGTALARACEVCILPNMGLSKWKYHDKLSEIDIRPFNNFAELSTDPDSAN